MSKLQRLNKGFVSDVIVDVEVCADQKCLSVTYHTHSFCQISGEEICDSLILSL